MNRLRVRVELNRRKAGVPLDELVSVVDETRKFFHLLAEDVQIPPDRGEWLASNFDPESLNFTAEYEGPATEEQIHAFGSAFGGATSLRRETIAQFTRIADFIGEDELVGFGLFQSDQETEPSDWRCLSRRDALRFAGEIHMLAQAAGEAVTPLPAVMNGSVGGRRLFKDRREREVLSNDPTRWLRDVESNLSRRISLLENQLEAQSNKVEGLGGNQEAADERFLKLLGAMESFWSQAPRQLAAAPAAQSMSAAAGAGQGSPTTSESPVACEPLAAPRKNRWRRWFFGFALVGAALSMAAVESEELAGRWSRLSQSIVVHMMPASVSASTHSAPAARELPVSFSKTDSGIESSRKETGLEMPREISLEVPADLKTKIQKQVRLSVNVGIDRDGQVTRAKVASAQGGEANLLASEALQTARRFHFRPARHGNKPVASQTVLTFVFDPDATFDPDIAAAENIQADN